MIKIDRADCPEVLMDSPSEGIYYNKKKVVSILWKMQREKCCYCEQHIPEKGHSKAVEHFRPRSVFTFLINDWKNLLLACALCNGKKSNKFPVELTDDSGKPKVLYLKTDSNGKPLIIDPSNPDIDPEKEIGFVTDDVDDNYGLPFAKNGSELGEITINEVGLDKEHLIKRRRTFLRQVLMTYYSMLLDARDEDNLDLLENYKDKFSLP